MISSVRICDRADYVSRFGVVSQGHVYRLLQGLDRFDPLPGPPDPDVFHLAGEISAQAHGWIESAREDLRLLSLTRHGSIRSVSVPVICGNDERFQAEESFMRRLAAVDLPAFSLDRDLPAVLAGVRQDIHGVRAGLASLQVREFGRWLSGPLGARGVDPGSRFPLGGAPSWDGLPLKSKLYDVHSFLKHGEGAGTFCRSLAEFLSGWSWSDSGFHDPVLDLRGFVRRAIEDVSIATSPSGVDLQVCQWLSASFNEIVGLSADLPVTADGLSGPHVFVALLLDGMASVVPDPEIASRTVSVFLGRVPVELFFADVPGCGKAVSSLSRIAASLPQSGDRPSNFDDLYSRVMSGAVHRAQPPPGLVTCPGALADSATVRPAVALRSQP